MTLWIDNLPVQGLGESFSSEDPVSNEIIWKGNAASEEQINLAVSSARKAFLSWKNTPFEQKEQLLINFVELIQQEAQELAIVIAKETGKPLWEARTEVAAMAGKIAISIKAYHERTGERAKEMGNTQVVLRHRGLGVMAVFGPYNFPAHLPNGHIVPALLAGNTVVFKPSELTPKTAEFAMQLWLKAGLPKGVINLVQGGRATGEALAKAKDIDGVFFTGSAQTGKILHSQFAGQPEKMLALEMGGNNPLIISEHFGDVKSTVYNIIQSAFISAGQRCTCARRLYLPKSKAGDELLAELILATKKLKIGGQFDENPPFIGSLISKNAAQNMIKAQHHLISLGAKALVEGQIIQDATVSPAILEVSNVNQLPDEEYFAPLLQVIRYQTFTQAIELANNTKYGLSAGLFSTQDDEWQYFIDNIRAGIVNRNRPLTGASSDMPFGGVGVSGNLRPSAYYAADYCAYPMASMEGEKTELPEVLSPGIELE